MMFTSCFVQHVGAVQLGKQKLGFQVPLPIVSSLVNFNLKLYVDHSVKKEFFVGLQIYQVTKEGTV